MSAVAGISDMRRVSFGRGIGFAWMLAKRDIRHKYATSYAGALWTILSPLFQSLVTVVVFSILMNGRMGDRYGDAPFPVFFFVALSLWQPFSEIIGRAPGILREHKYLISKIAFPVWTIPLVAAPSAALNQLVVIVITIVLMLNYGVSPGPQFFAYFVAALIAFILSIGISYAIAALAVYVPDIGQVTVILLSVLFWLTPILYPPTLVEAGGASAARLLIMDYNPLYHLIENARHAVIGSAAIDWTTMGLVALFAASVTLAGVALYRRLQPGFADVL